VKVQAIPVAKHTKWIPVFTAWFDAHVMWSGGDHLAEIATFVTGCAALVMAGLGQILRAFQVKP
jgi:hypothetical protein